MIRSNDIEIELEEALHEYSSYFTRFGLNKEEAIQYLLLGVSNDTIMIDRMGDIIKEIYIRITRESFEIKDVFKIMDLDVEEIKERILKGGNISKCAFEEVINKFKCIQDNDIKNKVGIKIFRMYWEDMKELILKIG